LERQTLKLAGEIARGLAAAHRRGLIHRDIKPANLWLDDAAGGRVKILDFGLARAAGEQHLTQTGALLGTPSYMAPEQARGQRVDGRADLFSLGVVLYRLCTGELPFKGNNTLSVLAALALETPAPPHLVQPTVSRPLSDLVMNLLEKDPSRHPRSAEEVLGALQRLEKEPTRQEKVKGQSGSTATSTSSSKDPDLPAIRTAPRRRRFALLLLAVLFAGLVGVAAWALTGAARIRDGEGTGPSEDGRASGTLAPTSAKEKGGKGSPSEGGREPGRSKGTLAKGWPKEIVNSIGMKLVRIPKGTFTMGSPKKEQDEAIKDQEKFTGKKFPEGDRWVFRAEGPQHEVEITREFWLGVHEVTQKQFKQVMGYNPSYFSRGGKGKGGAEYPFHQPAGGKDKAPADTSDFPVENVSWEEAREFCAKLSNRAEEKQHGRKHRLPSEAEWEYACRGGVPSYQVFHFGASLSSRQANFNGNFPYGGADKATWLIRTCKVGSYERNRFGLFDMHGNVLEWCADWYGADSYGKSPRKDPTGPAKGVVRVIRGGGWDNFGSSCRSAIRYLFMPGLQRFNLGFRVALVPSGR
jgi:formylglycine-generating enzyme required for sulfatase activity